MTELGGSTRVDLGDHLVLRTATRNDADRLAEFNAWIHRNVETDEVDAGVAAWTRDLMERPHPTVRPGDFTLVEDTRTGAVVSTLNLISQRWSYGGVVFGVGRPELVGTHPDYRNRGLVRAQFEVIHRRSAERGELVQAITGIPYFYRQFGYEFALALDGGRNGFRPHVPNLKPGESEPFRIRPALEADLGFITAVNANAARRWMVACVLDEEIFRYILLRRSPDSVYHTELRIIESQKGERVGFIEHPSRLSHSMLRAFFELRTDVSYGAATPSVLRYLWDTGQQYALRTPDQRCDAFQLMLGEEHPAYAAVASRLAEIDRPYAYYMRVADPARFLGHVRPALEARLAASPFIGHTGTLKIGSYGAGLRLQFDAGLITSVDPWRPGPSGESGDAQFPFLTFLQLLFGYRSLDDLRYAYPDCVASPDAAALLEVLFPRQASLVRALG